VEDVRYSRGMGFSQKKNLKLESEGHMCSKIPCFQGRCLSMKNIIFFIGGILGMTTLTLGRNDDPFPMSFPCILWTDILL